MDDMLKLGPKMKGTKWDQKGMSEIVQINISHQHNCINSFQISVAGGLARKTYGTLDGMNFNAVIIDHPSEYLVSVSGEYLNDKLASIVFVTNKKRHGPFGGTGGNSSNSSYQPFNFEFGPKNIFGGFHGSVYYGTVEAIGVYVKPYVV